MNNTVSNQAMASSETPASLPPPTAESGFGDAEPQPQAMPPTDMNVSAQGDYQNMNSNSNSDGLSAPSSSHRLPPLRKELESGSQHGGGLRGAGTLPPIRGTGHPTPSAPPNYEDQADSDVPPSYADMFRVGGK